MSEMQDDVPTAKRFCIYARRSSDEGSDKQTKSIPDQLKFCLEKAEDEGIVVAEKDIFTEKGSAKKAGNRPVFDKMLSLIRKGEIDGIISWHPDRLSRNMLEGGIIIDLIDEGKINDLKFCTHHFDNTAAGKMMLGILFAISKEYTDRLSVNVSRGLGTNLEKAISQGSYKWGYIRNEDGYYDQHPTFFPIVQRLWQMRLQGDSFDDILKWLSKMDCKRTVEKKDDEGRKIINTYTISRSGLTRIFRDPLYYGVLRQAQKGKVFLKAIDDFYSDFKPMVTEAQWQEVQSMGRSKVKLKTKQQFPFRGDLIHCECGASCYPTTGKDYLYIVCRAGAAHRKKKEPYRLRMKIVMEAVAELLKQDFKPSKVNYERYVAVMRRAIDSDLTDVRKQRSALTARKEKTQKALEDLILAAMGFVKGEKRMSETEERVYERRKFSLESEIKQCDDDLATLKHDGLLQTFDYEEFSNFLRSADLYWKRADADQKHALARFLFSNIQIGGGKVLTIAYKPLIKDLFVLDGGSGGT
ncbi:MAG TPA: recombinase family protein [Candidatus Peribacteraceae bacterium]|nr:recombinase family protein [Candidatus Peribacteraceae bacterium]